MSHTPFKFPKQTIRDVDLHNKTILLRADYNVPLESDGTIASDYRIIQSLPTLEYLLKRGCRVVVIAHLGRPDGRVDNKLSLAPIADYLKKRLPDYKVAFNPSTTDDVAWQACKAMPVASLMLLENLRFDSREEANDSEFAAILKRVSGANYFVQDGFGVVHRAHASTEAITHLLPSLAGLLLEREVTTLCGVMAHPKHPLVAVVGGAKISDKIDFIEQLLKSADSILIGGAMANTFLQYQGFSIGKSKIEENQHDEIATILQKAKNNQIVLPVDVVVSDKIAKQSQYRTCEVDAVAADEYILDVGPKTLALFGERLRLANTALWNGTLGMAEIPQYAKGSAKLAHDLSEQHHSLKTVVGGGDTADFVLDWLRQHPHAQFEHVSTGGGASLELMSGLKLPGVEALIGK